MSLGKRRNHAEPGHSRRHDSATGRRTPPGRLPLLVVLLFTVAVAALVLWTREVTERLEAERQRLATIVAATGPADFAPAAIPQEANAMPLLVAAAGELPADALARSDRARRLASLPLAEWNDEDREVAGRIVAEHGRVLALLLAAGELPAAGLDLDYSEAPTPDPADSLALLGAARFVCVAARRALANGDDAAAGTAWPALALLVEGLRREPPLFLQLVGNAAERLALQLVHEVATRPGGDRALRARMASDLERLQALPTAFDSLRYEAVLGLGYAERLEEGLGPVRLWLRRHLGAPWLLEIEGFYCRQRELLAVARNGGFEVTDRIARGDSAGCPPATAAATLVSKLAEALVDLRATEAARALALTSLAVRRHAEERGAYPPALAEIDSDAYTATLTGEAPFYERQPDGGAHLTLPRLEALWEERGRRLGMPERSLPLEYRLPPPGVSRAAPRPRRAPRAAPPR